MNIDAKSSANQLEQYIKRILLTPWSSGIYPRGAKMYQYVQNNQGDTPH